MNTDVIEKKILLRAPLQRVWRALSDATEFGTWFGIRFESPFVPGAVVAGVMMPTTVDPEVGKAQKPYEGTRFEITIQQMEPPRVFSFRWHPGAVDKTKDYSAEPMTLVAFQLEEVKDGVMLTLTESGFDQLPLDRRQKSFSDNEHGWTMMVKVIEAYIAGKP
ncbi:MAG: SRPBCC family protein [Acidobacteriota bacterium]